MPNLITVLMNELRHYCSYQISNMLKFSLHNKVNLNKLIINKNFNS